jgi:hypothetical protein
MAEGLASENIPKNPPSPDYVWEIDKKRKMWVYKERGGVAMVLVLGNGRRYYQDQHYELIINALFQRQLQLTIDRDNYRDKVEELKEKIKELKASK